MQSFRHPALRSMSYSIFDQFLMDKISTLNYFLPFLTGVGGHGGTGIHADKNDKYKEIIQRISLYAVPDLAKCSLSETKSRDKNVYSEEGSLQSLDYSVHEVRSGLDGISSFSSLTITGMARQLEQSGQNAPQQQVQEVPVVQAARCRVCSIL